MAASSKFRRAIKWRANYPWHVVVSTFEVVSPYELRVTSQKLLLN